jgi:hypothetical protein
MTGSEPQLCRLGFPNDEYIYVGKYGEGIREEKRRQETIEIKETKKSRKKAGERGREGLY